MTSPSRWSSLLLLFALLLVEPSAASAQLPSPPEAPSSAEIAEARQDFVLGMELARAERWEAALERFVRSYELSGSPVALFNLASTLRSTGRFREASEAFDRLLADPSLGAETRAEAERIRSEVAAHVAVITVRGVPDGPAEVLTDGQMRETTERRPIDVSLDPGVRVLVVDLPDQEAWRWSGEIEDGARFTLDAELVAAGPVADEEGVDPLPFVVAGVAIAAVVVGIVIGVVVDDAAQLGPRTPYVLELP